MLDEIATALVFAPHPDDEVLGAGGTIRRLANKGTSVHVAIVTRGMPPRFEAASSNGLRQELARSHEILGVSDCHFCDFPAAELDRVAHADINARLGALVAEIRPDLVFVPFVGDIHADHQITFNSALVACRPRHSEAPKLVMAYETLSETNWNAPGATAAFHPNVFIDISATLEAKIAAFQAYASQQKAFPDERSVEALRALAITRGATVYRSAAEAFMLVRAIG
jgi:N-acetylglucosamine malate deacetylase 1